MKVIIEDSQTLKTIEPDQLAAYLQTHGWHEDRPFLDNATIWLLRRDGAEEYEILLPLKQSLGDYTARIREALQTLEMVEKRSEADILSDLVTTLPNVTIQSLVINLQEGATAGKVTLMGVVLGKLRRIQLELAEPIYELAIKAYQARIPIACQGDLVKQGRSFVLQNPHHFTLDLDAWIG